MNESFMLVKSETIPLTFELAERHRTLQSPPTERPLKPERVRFLLDRAKNGFFLPVSWAIATVGDKSTPKRVNGQHSSNALCELKENFPRGLLCHLDHFRVKDDAALVTLFRQFDARVSNRSKSDVAGAFQGMQPNLRKLKTRFAMLSAEGIAWWRRNLEGTPVLPGDGVFEIFQEPLEHPFIEWSNGVVSNKTPQLCHKAIIAAMYEGFAADEADAKKFWSLVAQGGGYDGSNHPATKLDDWLKDFVGKKGLKPGALYQGSMYAWNAFREGKSIASIKSDARRSLLRNVSL